MRKLLTILLILISGAAFSQSVRIYNTTVIDSLFNKLKSDITKLKTENSSMRASITKLQSTITKQQADIARLQKDSTTLYIKGFTGNGTKKRPLEFIAPVLTDKPKQ